MASHALGFFTASTIAPLLTGKGDTLIAGGITHAEKIGDERCVVLGLPGPTELEEAWGGNDSTEWGNLYEPDAILTYEERTFNSVHSRQEGVVLKDQWLSCTPDGLVGTDGMIEVKCPAVTKNHRERIKNPESFRAEYNDQCQFSLMLTGREWCDLVSFDWRFKAPLDLVIVRIHADPDWQERTKSRLAQAEAVITDLHRMYAERSKQPILMTGAN